MNVYFMKGNKVVKFELIFLFEEMIDISLIGIVNISEKVKIDKDEKMS